MTVSPDITILINNFNYGRFLSRAIDSALQQDEVQKEIIVVDDGSTDNSREVIARYGREIRPILKPNGGQASAMNAGVAVAKAPILAFLDADDWWVPRKCAAVLAAFQAEPEAGLVYHRLQPSYSDLRPAFRAIPRSLCEGDLAPRLLRSGGRWPFPMTSSLSVRRSTWDDAGAIPESFRISADAWLTGVLPFLAKVVALPEALGHYRIHDNTWFRHKDDRAMLLKRMAHWEATVEVTNRFLRRRGRPERLELADHFDHQAATARLGLAGAPRLLALARLGLRDPGEPNPIRRARATLRAIAALRHVGPEPVLPKRAP